MRVLVLAPHPFFQERGTPIDVLLVLRVLAERPDVELELLTYHEGEDVDVPGLTIHRIRRPPGVHHVRPGFSAKKLVCDLYMFLAFIRLLSRNRYDLVHAGEESAFFALLARRFSGVPYVYDLDSSIAQQLVESRPWLAGLGPRFSRVEGSMIREALVALPVCEALAELCREHGAKRVVPLYDISQLSQPDAPRTGVLRRELGAADDDLVVLYTGNLEPYQGVDLLVDAFAIAAREEPRLRLAVIGGVPDDVEALRSRIEAHGLRDRAAVTGPRPFEDLHLYLADADILACPRVRGINTPMKIYPYLHTAKPVIATDLPTHTQLLTPDLAMLAPPTPQAFARGMLELARDPELRVRLGAAGRELIEREHTYEAHRRRLNDAYDWIAHRLEEGEPVREGLPNGTSPPAAAAPPREPLRRGSPAPARPWRRRRTGGA